MPRLYIQEAAAGYTPTTFHGAWDASGSAITRAMALYPTPQEIMGEIGHSDTPLLKVAVSETSTNTSWDVCLLRLVSPPLAANITLDDPISLLLFFYESLAAADFYTHVHMWVTQGDSNLERGVLVTDYIGVTEWVTDTNARFVSIAPAITSVAAQAGDRIVIEFGYRATNASVTSYTGTVWYGSSDGLLDGDTGLTNTSIRHLGAFYNPYINVTDAIDFTITTRITALQAEVAVQAPDNLGTTRLTQMSIEEIVTQLATVRMTQMAIEVLVVPPTVAPEILWNPLPVRCQATYWANLYDFNGNLIAVFDDFKPLTIEHRINGYSNCTFSIDGLDSRINLFKLDYILEVWRDIGDVRYIEFEGVHRSDQLQYTEGGHWIYTSYSRSFEDFLMRRCVLYRNLAKVLEADGVTWHGYTLKQTYADDVMKEFVNENLGPGANNHVVGDPNTRLVNGAMPNFNIEPNTSQGPIYFANFSYLNLYEVLQKIAEATGVDFRVRRFSGNQFEFITRYPMLGSDKSATLVFSPEYGNMTIPSWTLTRTEEVNVVAVLGQGENTYRHALTFESASTMDSPWNRRETTHDSSNDTGQGFIDTSTEVLNNLKAKEEFTFSVMQTDASAYGYDYVLGDVCTVKFGAITKQKKVTGIVINVSDGKEDIKVSFSDYPTVPPT